MKNRLFLLLLPAVFVLGLLLWNRAQSSDAPQQGADTLEITMYRGEGCNCCIKWADYLEENGFEVRDELVDNLMQVKTRHGIPSEVASCHTAVIDGYVVEGHVPSREIRRLVRERPEATGIAVPGMTVGSPGMEASYSQPYNVYLFDDEGNRIVYAEY